MNINLTTEQARMVDETAKEYGFANRSEFLRAILRYIFLYSPGILGKLDTVTFEEPPTKNVDEIIANLKSNKQYNQKFIKSVAAGLKKSKHRK